MKRSTRPRAIRAAVMTGVSLLAVGFAGTSAEAAPDAAPTEQQLGDYIAAGLKQAGPVAGVGTGSACTSGSGAGSGNGSGDCFGGSGSSSGLSGGYSSDTQGYGPAMTSWTAAFGYGLANPDAAPRKPTTGIANPAPSTRARWSWSTAPG